MSETMFFAVLVVLPLILLWAVVIVDLVGRDDLSIGQKLLWGVAVIVLVAIGVLVYLIARPFPYPEDSASAGSRDETSAALLEAVTAHEEGVISDVELTAAKDTAKMAVG